MSYILDTKLQSQTIYLTSSNAIGRNPFIFQFNNLIQKPTNIKMILSVEEFVISNSFNNIYAPYNEIYFTKSSFPIIQLAIPAGLYNINSFITQLNSQLIPYAITAVYNPLIFKLSFVCTQEISIVFCSFANMIGVSKDNKNQYIYPINSSLPNYTIFMPGVIDFSGTSYIFLKCDDLALSNINSYGVINNTLARIPINSPYGYKIYYRPTETIKYMLNNYSISTLTFYLEDVLNNIIDIGSSEFQLLLKISYIYTPEEKNNLELTLEHHLLNLPVENTE